MKDVLRKMTLVALALALLFAQAAAAKKSPPGGNVPSGNAFGHTGFSDGR